MEKTLLDKLEELEKKLKDYSDAEFRANFLSEVRLIVVEHFKENYPANDY